MKACLTLFVLFFAVSCYGQKIHFTDTTNVWMNVHVRDTIPNHPVYNYWEDHYVKDSVISGKHYRQFTFGLVREDSVGKKLYLRRTDPDTDLVLMDYTLAVGDTFRTGYYDTAQLAFIVQSTDSTLINNAWHKMWLFARWQDGQFTGWCQFLEGFGCLQTPVFMVQQELEAFGDYWYAVYCFTNKGEHPALHPALNSFDNITSCTLQASELIKPVTKIYPNPATSEVNITSGEALGNVRVTNVLGQCVFTSFYRTGNAVINVGAWVDGVYFVEIAGGTVQRFVKE